MRLMLTNAVIGCRPTSHASETFSATRRALTKEATVNCPLCINVELNVSWRQGIEIDCCPQCRGVWLDRGELDKIIQLSNSSSRSSDDQHQQRGQKPVYGGQDDSGRVQQRAQQLLDRLAEHRELFS
jgi:Zn-finger nucleic acid-binding protein